MALDVMEALGTFCWRRLKTLSHCPVVFANVLEMSAHGLVILFHIFAIKSIYDRISGFHLKILIATSCRV